MNVATFTSRRLGWRGLTALILVPLLVAGTFLAGTWGFDRNVRRVEAAVVNLDEMVTIDGQAIPLGRQLSAALVDSDRVQNLTWVLADEANARDGLATGRFVAVVTIPKEFSAAATSVKDAKGARQATISVQTSPVAGIAEAALGQSIADAAVQSLNQFLSGQYLDRIYLGFNQMGEQFVTVADAAGQLADGNAKLADGLGEAASGSKKLADGLGEAASGGQTLKSKGAAIPGGAERLASGLETMAAQTKPFPGQVAQLADGAESLASGTRRYADGVGQYVDGINSLVDPMITLVQQLPDLAPLFASIDELMKDLPTSAHTINTQVTELAKLIEGALGDADQLKATLATYLKQAAAAQQIVDAVASGAKTVPCPERLQAVEGGCEAFAEGVKSGGQAASDALSGLDAQQLNGLVTQIIANRDQIKAALDQMVAATTWLDANATQIQARWDAIKAQIPVDSGPNQYLLSQLTRLRDGGTQLKSGGQELASGSAQVASGTRKLADGVPALVDGIGQSAGGARTLADGLAAYVSGVGQFADGVSQASSGAGALASGIGQAASGSRELADGSRRFADELAQGAGKIPNYSASDRKTLATVVSSAVDGDGLTALVSPMAAVAALLAIVALWLGALATYILVRPIDPRTAASSAPTWHLVARPLVPGLTVAAVQALGLTVLTSLYLGLGWGSAALLGVVLMAAGAAFVAVNHALAAWGGIWGRVASGVMLLVVAVLAVTASAPGVFGALRPLSPLAPGLDGVHAIITGSSVAVALVVLLGWALLGLLASGYRVARARVVPIAALAAA